jgi:hypothetical protein
MAISRPTYATREEVKAALDVKATARMDAQVDEAIEAASDSVEGFLQRVFYPTLATRYFNWPNYQFAPPWEIWLEENEVADVTGIVPVVKTGTTVIPAGNLLWEPANQGPPYMSLEINRSSTSTFGTSSTPQRDVSILALFGYWARTVPAGALAATVMDTTGTAVTVTNSNAVGVGDTILVDSERLLVADKSMLSTGQAQQGAGCSTASSADVSLGVVDGTKYFVGETLLLDSERMLVVDIAGNTVTVKRAWDGSVLATHTAATVYAQRLLTVVRGALGTTATTHANAAPVLRGLVPGLVKDVTIGEAVLAVVAKGGVYATTQGEGAGKQGNIGAGLADLRTRCRNRYGRKARIEAV